MPTGTEIRGAAKTVKQLLSGSRFSVDYYQREYRWETKQITELLEDLETKFFEDYKPNDEPADVEHYGHYFLGSIIISDKDGRKFLIDGQQRLTTLTLLLIHLNRNLSQQDREMAQLTPLIYAAHHGTRSFNIDVDERRPCMEALLNARDFHDDGQSESVTNILARFEDIEELFPGQLRGRHLPFFVDWLTSNVHLVEITAYSDEDAYTIFETMNDRGLPLTPVDMLKSYLLANIKHAENRNQVNQVWRSALLDLGTAKDADEMLKAWLRSQFAETIRDSKINPRPQDFERIGTEMHRWVRDRVGLIGLVAGDEYERFIREQLTYYQQWYLYLRRLATTPEDGEPKSAHFLDQYSVGMMYPLALAPLRLSDTEEEAKLKIDAVLKFLDIFIARRLWNNRAIDYAAIHRGLFGVVKDIRSADLGDVRARLLQRLENEEQTFSSNPAFALTEGKQRSTLLILARLTEFVETSSGRQSHYLEYVRRGGGKSAYEVEHVWANHFERHQDEFSHPADFASYRNRLGGLLLLPKSFNASYSDLTYEKKRSHYFGQNLLAQSLCEEAYENDPGLRRFVQASVLPFHPHPSFFRADLDERQLLYQRVAELVWSPDLLRD